MAGGLWNPDPTREPIGGEAPFPGGGDGSGFTPPPRPGGNPSLGGFGYGSRGVSPTFPASGFSRLRNRRMSRPSWMSGNGVPGTGVPSTAPETYQTSQTPQPSGNSYFDELINNRFGGMDTGYTHAGGTDAEALLDLIIGGQSRGAWGPGGDPRVMEAYDADANRRGLALEDSMVLGADLEGGDFWNRGLARTLARGNAGRARNDFLNQNRLDAARRYSGLQDFALRHKVGEYDTQRAREAQLADRDHDSGGGFPWETVGSIAGAGLGALVGQPGLGAAVGGGAGKGISGGRNMSEYPRYNYLGSGRTY